MSFRMRGMYVCKLVAYLHSSSDYFRQLGTQRIFNEDWVGEVLLLQQVIVA